MNRTAVWMVVCGIVLTFCLGRTPLALAQPATTGEEAATTEAAPTDTIPGDEQAVDTTKLATETAPAETKSDVPPTSVTHPINQGDNAWMLMSCALVLFMTVPGLALFYGGLVRKKNVLGVMMQCLTLMALMTVIWATYGFSLSFGGTNPWIGNLDYLFMNGVQATGLSPDKQLVFPMKAGYGIPMLTFMMFQGMFFIITPALICGAFAERMKFSTMVVFSILWGTLVYCPLAHWVWGGGILAYDTEGSRQWAAGGALDYAGGTVVHISSGVSALVCAVMIGKRIGYGTQPMPPHNLTYTILGAGMLWVGWFGFNAGSGLAADGLAANALVVTQYAAATGTLTWAVLEWVLRGKPSVLGAASGAVAGLVCITPAAGYVQPMPALAMGVAAGAVCFFACTTLKHTFGYDDALDAFGVHGVGGALGAILTGVFATHNLFPAAVNDKLGLLEGGTLIVGQLVAVAVSVVWAVTMTIVLLLILKVTMGLRVTQQGEVDGLDMSQHGEEGYIFI